jgi:two-component system, chemotaxis family, response regulator Rcp1
MPGAPHLFLIEDNAGDVLLFRQILDDQGIPAHVHVARDGDQAMFMLAEHRFEPDLIVLDLNLPRLSGSSFLAQAKPKAPVVVFSSSSNQVDIKNCVDLGAREFIPKPTDLREYADRVSRIVRDWLPTDQSLKIGETHESPPIHRSRRNEISTALIPNRTAARSLANFFLNNAKEQRAACRAAERFFNEHPNQWQWNEEMRELVGEELEKLASKQREAPTTGVDPAGA